MAVIDQYSVKELACEIDPLAVASWPARENAALDGWLLRFTDGFSSRSNSVSTLDYKGLSPLESVAQVEAAFRARGLVPQFQITPATTPVELESLLKRRGYVAKPSTMLMVADAQAVAGECDVQIERAANPAFVHLTREGSHSSADGDERLGTLARAPRPKAFALMCQSGEAVACGASVVTDRWAGIFVMRTAPAFRGRGFGKQVLSALASWASEEGADHLYLQVDEANTPARKLYDRAGFVDGYRYLHYERRP